MGFVTRAEKDSKCHGEGCMSTEDEIKRLAEWWEAKAVKLTETIKSREARINELTGDMEEVQANFAAIRESNERLRKERDELKEKLAEEIKWWSDRYTIDSNQHIGAVAVYESVIKMLTGRD